MAWDRRQRRNMTLEALWGIYERKPRKYVRKPEHQPKDLTPEEIQKREWKASQSPWRRCADRGKWKRLLKEETSRSYRAWLKQATHRCLNSGLEGEDLGDCFADEFRGDKFEYELLDRWAYD